MHKPSMLIVDDELCIREFIQDLTEDFAEPHLAANGKEAIEVARRVQLDLILMDLLMPGKNGLDVGTELLSDERTKDVPIIMLTGRNDSEDRVRAFDTGFDDYLTKPFRPDEFVARIKSKLNRSSERKATMGGRGDLKLSCGNLLVDLGKLRVFVKDRELHVSHVEFKILCLLCQNSGHTVLRNQIEEYVWGGDKKPSDRALDPHVFSLRKKLKSTGLVLRTSYRGGFTLLPTSLSGS